MEESLQCVPRFMMPCGTFCTNRVLGLGAIEEEKSRLNTRRNTRHKTRGQNRECILCGKRCENEPFIFCLMCKNEQP